MYDEKEVRERSWIEEEQKKRIKVEQIKNPVVLLDSGNQILMGKTKTKYPVKIRLEFYHMVIEEAYYSQTFQLQVVRSPLTYAQIEKVYQVFVKKANIILPAVIQLFYDDNEEVVSESFQLEVPKILDQYGGRLTFVVQSQIYLFIEDINANLNNIWSEIQQIKQHLNDIPTKEELALYWKNPPPQLTQNQSSMTPNSVSEKTLDLGVLFSEPIFDQMKKKPAANPVDFRSEIQRLHTALKSSMKVEINLKCEIATKQNLKHLVKYSSPKILHIICHGTSEGALEFEDDSRTVLGTLQTVKTDEIIQTLRNCVDFLPEVVFINSCYSQRVGQAFFKMGINYVISIDSEDTIDDEAAQIFSEHFYRNIFSGQKVKDAFSEAKERVKLKHNSFGCCCRHSAKEKHKPNCRWMEMIRKSPNSDLIDDQQRIEKHKLFHVPSEICTCDLKHMNRHKQTCEWARQALFHINNDFRIKDGDTQRFPKFPNEFPSYLPQGYLVICCCFNYESPNEENGGYRLPHSESNKFKIFENTQNIKNQAVFDISTMGRQLYKQINDLTSPELLQTHQKIESSIMGRQRQIFEFMKKIKDLFQMIYIVYGPVGVGRTSFVLKCVTYLIERRVFEMYFYIDLYGIRDRDIFRYKFNEITKFNYDGEVKLQKVKNKMMIIILDNADDFFELQRDQLYEQLNSLRKELHKSKVILTLKEQNSSSFNTEKVHSEKYVLEPLSILAATRLIFVKMRHMFDLSVQYNEIDGLVRSNQALRIPKFIESLSQSFSSTITTKKKIKAGDIKKKLEIILEGDGAGNKLIEENIKCLKEKSEDSYNLLLFMAQFSEGISIQDFKMLAIYDRKESLIRLPIGKNWQVVLATLFQKKHTEQGQKNSLDTQSNFTQESDLSNPSLRNIQSNANQRQNNYVEKQITPKKITKGESYFLEEISENRYIVKRFIRDFIWKKHQSDKNYQMKFLFVGHLSVMLELYFKWLIDSKYIHEDLVECSALSDAGVFGIKDHIFEPPQDLSKSAWMANKHKSEFQKLITDHQSLVQKLRKSDPSVFVANHKQDFLNIYEKRWDIVFNYLKSSKDESKGIELREDKVCITYLENLTIFIPTAFKIAKVETTLLKYIISKSMSMLSRLEKYCQDEKYFESHKILCLQLKLNLMKVSIDMDKLDADELKNELEANKQFTTKLMKSIHTHNLLDYAKTCWNYQKTYLLMCKQYLSRKDIQNKVPSEKIKAMNEKLHSWLSENWDLAQLFMVKPKQASKQTSIQSRMTAHSDRLTKQSGSFFGDDMIEFIQINKQPSKQETALHILYCKRNLIIGLYYLLILKFNSGAPSIHSNTIKLKKEQEKSILELLTESAKTFQQKGLMKLCLRAKITIIQIEAFQIINPKKKLSRNEAITSQINENSTKGHEEALLLRTDKKLANCEQIYSDRRNNLIGFMQFENEIKKIKNLIKEKLWASSSDTLVCMRPVPLIINGDTPIIQNLVRKKNRFRKEIQKVVNPQIDLCTKFQILTKAKFKEEVQNGCTMLLLTANVKVYDKKPFLVFEGIRMEEDLVEINHAFVQEYDLSKIKILMIAGNNAFEAIKQLEKILVDPPVMISLGNPTLNISPEELKRQTTEYKRPQDLHIFTIKQKRKTEIAFLRQFIRILMEKQIRSKEQIQDLCQRCEYIIKDCLQLRVLHQKRKSPFEIKHKKGTYKDLSPGYQKNHNIDMKNKSTDNSNFICIRRWMDTYRVFEHIRKRAAEAAKAQSQNEVNPAAYINVFGQIGSGKSTFVHEIARLFVQRERYSAGVYIIDGKVLEKKYQGEFENYFTKESQAGKIMTLEEFQQNGNEHLMLIIDDFHMVKPRSNGRFNLFLQKIVDKRVNLIIVTNMQYQEQQQKKKDNQFIFKVLRPIKVEKLCLLEIDLIASYILPLKDPYLLEKYEEMKTRNFNLIRVQDLYDLKSNFYGRRKQHEFSIESAKDMKKMHSLNQG